MKVKTVTYRRTKQVARFEPEEIELTIDLNSKSDTVEKAVALARATVKREFGESPCPRTIEAMRAQVKAFEEVETFA